jgi:hypothetical protein
MSDRNKAAKGGSSPSALFGGITKEMWTVLLDKPEGWQGSDVFCDTREQAESQLATLREIDAKYRPESTELAGAVVTRCIVSIYPPNAQDQP